MYQNWQRYTIIKESAFMYNVRNNDMLKPTRYENIYDIFYLLHYPLKFSLKLDVDPQRNNDASPMMSYRCM